jgi:predicted extracellular nuclease
VFTSSFEDWSGPNSPDGWIGNVVAGNATNFTLANITQSSDAQEGVSSCRLANTTSTHQRFTTSAVNVNQGEAYTITFWAKGAGDIRTSIVTLNTNGSTNYATYNAYIAVTNTWTQYTQTITSPNTSLGEFIFSVKSTVAPDHLMIDNVVITGGSVTPPTGYVSIYDIQYTTDASGSSTYVGQTVETSGIVTATYGSGYFIQNGVGPWTGIHVFNNSNTPAIGDSVSITGNVVEYFNLTQITGVTGFVNHSSGNTLPLAVEITSAQSKTEPYEGVLVKVMNAECTNTNSGFGMWKINTDADSSKVHSLFYAYTPVLGGVYNITGVINYSFDEFRVCPRSINDIEVLSDNVTSASINQIQSTTAADGASPFAGQTVATAGVVSGIYPDEGFFIQNGTGPWSGIFVFNTAINPVLGDSIELTANVVEYFGLTQLSSVSAFEIIENVGAPAATVVTSAQANSEMYESVLIRVENAICTNPNAGFGMFRINNSTADVLVGDNIFDYDPVLGNGYNVQGPLWFSFGEFKIFPRFASDVELIGFASLENGTQQAATLYPNPATESFAIKHFEGEMNIVDAQGRVVFATEINANNNVVDVNGLQAGVYFVVLNSNNVAQTIRFVKK